MSIVLVCALKREYNDVVLLLYLIFDEKATLFKIIISEVHYLKMEFMCSIKLN